jgi:hypothetical protein
MALPRREKGSIHLDAAVLGSPHAVAAVIAQSSLDRVLQGVRVYSDDFKVTFGWR